MKVNINRDAETRIPSVVKVISVVLVDNRDVVRFVPVRTPVFRPPVHDPKAKPAVLKSRVPVVKVRLADTKIVLSSKRAIEASLRNVVAAVPAALRPGPVIGFPVARAEMLERATLAKSTLRPILSFVALLLNALSFLVGVSLLNPRLLTVAALLAVKGLRIALGLLRPLERRARIHTLLLILRLAITAAAVLLRTLLGRDLWPTFLRPAVLPTLLTLGGAIGPSPSIVPPSILPKTRNHASGNYEEQGRSLRWNPFHDGTFCHV